LDGGGQGQSTIGAFGGFGNGSGTQICFFLLFSLIFISNLSSFWKTSTLGHALGFINFGGGHVTFAYSIFGGGKV